MAHFRRQWNSGAQTGSRVQPVIEMPGDSPTVVSLLEFPFSMATFHSPVRGRPPPPVLSQSLLGLEKAIPPGAPSPPPRSNPSRSPISSSSKIDKPLPQHPSRSSSIYSNDSGYTKIIQSYADREEDEPPVRKILQPKALRETISGLLHRRFSQAHSSKSITPYSNIPKHGYSVSVLSLTPSHSSAASAPDSRNAPSFVEFSRNLRQRRELVSPTSSKFSQDVPADLNETLSLYSLINTTDNRATLSEQDHQCRPWLVPASSAEVVDSGLIPPPLNLGKTHRNSEALENARKMQGERLIKTIKEERALHRLSQDSFSSDSFVIYNGAREVVKAMIKEKIQKKKSKSEQNDEGQIMSCVSEKWPSTNSQSESPTERKFSWMSSRRPSLQQGVTSLLRKLSISAPHSDEDDKKGEPKERGLRPKQKAIPTTPYQKYGAEIWFAKNKKKRAKRAAQRAAAAARNDSEENRYGKQHSVPARGTGQRETATTPSARRSRELANTLQNGRSQLIGLLDSKKRQPRATASERRREKLKKSITLIGPVDQGLDGSWI